MKSAIETKNAPAAIGPYSQAICFNKTLFISGQIPLDPASGNIVGNDIESQTHQVLKNIDTILQKAGTSKDNIIKTTIFITNMTEFPLVNTIYEDYLNGTLFPARSTIEVSALPKGALVEIEVIAAL
ncbi:RidA family protein [Morganella morganii]|uniref:RidA family protein n=1 Tax=Gammaproteobacteria TaxID=1236 RepID=UPI001649542D|nr:MULTISPECIES: RidA family protein [Gammaproteobacteria]MBC3996203.1 RidA family protein [Morganella morganii]MBT0385267.1 RidA family protein [Morganella morganii subsp. morganii]MCG6490164.1 RidA family protein [Vibrio parahaemolyticus]